MKRQLKYGKNTTSLNTLNNQFSLPIMKSLKYLTSILFILTLTFASAQEELPAVLTNDDISLFIKSYKPLKKDLMKLGDEYENISDPTALQSLEANEKAQAIFNKYGWDNDYISKFNAIIKGYAYVKVKNELDLLPEDQKKYMAPTLDMMKLQVNLEDAKKVANKVNELDIILEDE